MSDSVKQILERLGPAKASIIVRPMSEEELASFEKQVGLPIPPALREYFATVGLFQDLTDYGASEYEVHSRGHEFVISRQFLVKHFGPAAANLFPFAGDGAGDEIAVAERNGELRFFFADHETHEIRDIRSFAEWLNGVVEVAGRRKRPTNEQKIWSVQFSFDTPEPEPILDVIRQFASANLGRWSEERVSPSGVYTSNAPLAFGERQLTMNKLDLRHPWGTPSYSFDFDEPATLPSPESLIRRLDIAFRNSSLGYKLVDYGPISLGYAEDEDIASVSTRQKRPWWKFW